MPILIRPGMFLIWTLITLLLGELLLLNVLASEQWTPSLGLAANFTTTPKQKAKAAGTCSRLREELGSEVVQVYGEGVYVDAIQNPNSLYNSFYRPACVVAPRQDVHVQKAMLTIYNDRVRYAVMSGGHSAMNGWNMYVESLFFFLGRSWMLIDRLECARRSSYLLHEHEQRNI